jgi:Flp pilus assembly protein TadG
MAPLLLTFMLGTVDISNSVQTAIRLERAARAGAQYAVADASDMAAVRNSVIAAWPELTTTDVPLPVLSCECASVGVACTASCAGGLVRIVTVTASRALSPMLLTTLTRSTGNAVARLQ